MIQYAQHKILIGIGVFSLLGNVAIGVGLLLFISCLYSISRKMLLVGGILLVISIEGTILGIYFDNEEHNAFTFYLCLFYFFVLGLSIVPLVSLLPVELLDPRPLSFLVAGGYFVKLLIVWFS